MPSTTPKSEAPRVSSSYSVVIAGENGGTMRVTTDPVLDNLTFKIGNQTRTLKWEDVLAAKKLLQENRY